MAENIQWDEEIVWDDQVSPEIVSAIQQPMSVEETLTQPQSMWETLTSPTQPQPFSVGNIAKDVAIGAGLGALYTGPTAGAGAIMGAGAGLAGGTLSELARATGQAPLTQVAAGAFGGEIPVVAKVSGKGVLKAFDWKKGRIAEEISDLSPKQSFEILKAKKDLYGDMLVGKLYTTEKSDIVQNEVRQKFPEIEFKPNEKASTTLRQKLFDDVSKNNDFTKSPEYAELTRDIQISRELVEGSKGDLPIITKIFNAQQSKFPEARERSTKSILNLVQSGGKFNSKKGEAEKLISDEAQQALKNRFEQYLERTVGSNSYQELKSVEALEFGALAEDAMNTLKQTNFKFADKGQQEQLLLSLKNSPTGGDTFKKSFTEYLGTLKDESAMKAAFNRMRPVMDDLNVLSRAQQEDVYKRVIEFEKTVAKNKKAQVTRDLLTGALVGGQSPITNQPINRPVQEILYPQRSPIKAFNM